VIVERVRFSSADTELVGDIYRPSTSGSSPAAVVAGSWTTVKEQMAAHYARGLAQRGIAALAFDFRGTGESGGVPRDAESPSAKAADLVAAAQFLRESPGVDPNRVGAVGVCAGAGYVACAASSHPALRWIGLVAPWLHDAELVGSVYGGEDGVRRRIELGDRAAKAYRDTGVVEYVPAVSTTDEAAAMYGPMEYYLDSSRGAIPQWPNRFAVLSWPAWLRFDPIAVAPSITVPTVVVHSPDAAIPEGVRRFHSALACPKALHWLSGTQFDFYDDPSTVSAALDIVVEHLRATV
jgi:uncharacterized protein